MYEYHVTCGAFKKIIKSESNTARNIHDLIKKAFSLDLNCPLHLQYWHPRHNDWLDCEESDENIEGTKLNVWQNALGLQKPEFSSSSSNITSHPSTPSINFTTSTVFEEFSPVDQQPSQQRNTADFPNVYKLPMFPLWLQNLLDTHSPLCKEAKCQRAVTDALFEDLLQYGYYPTSRMFQETCWALVEAHPILKDKESANGQPHDSWVLRLRDKFKKFRSRHAELCNAEELKRMKEKFGHKKDRSRLNLDNCLEDSLTSVKHIKKMYYVVQLDSDIFKEKIVVPSIWLDKNDTLCLLPPILDIEEVETLAKAQCTPEHGWQMHCVSFIQSFDTYSQAKENIKKDKEITIELEEEEIKQHHKEVREKRKRKLLQFLEQHSIESDDEEEDCGSTQEDCTMNHDIVLYPAIVKMEILENLNVPENDQQSCLNTTHDESSSSVHSTLEHDSQLHTVTSSSSIKRMKFAIAKFTTEYDYVAIISSNWITDDRKSCRYPNSPNVERLLKKRIEPTPDWKTYPIEIMKEYETFSEAQEHFTKVEDTSNSDSEPYHCLKRKRTAPNCFNNEELKEDKVSSRTSLDSFSSSTQPVSISSITNSISPITSITSTVPSILSVSSSFHSMESSTRSSELSNASSCFIASETSQINFQEKVIQMLESLHSDIKYIKDAINLKNCHNALPQLPPNCPKFPCENSEDLTELENILQDEGNFTSICSYLSTIGGSCVKDATRRILQHLMSNTLCLKYNWKGTRGIKHGFATFTLITKLILGAVRKNPSSASAKQVEVNNVIKTWLMHAKDRDGGRNARAIISNGYN